MDEIPVFHHGCLLSINNDSRRGVYTVKGKLPGNLLNTGTYYFKLIFGENQRHALLIKENFLQFEVLNESIGSNMSILPGVIRPNIPYDVSFNQLENEFAAN